MIVRLATFADVEAMIGIAAEMHATLDLKRLAPFDRAHIEALIAAAVHDDDKLAAVAEDAAGVVIGIVVALTQPHWFNPSVKFAQEIMIWVRPGSRHSGAGAALVRFFEEWAVSKSLPQAALSSTGNYYRKKMAKLCHAVGYVPESIIYMRGLPCPPS